MNTSIIRYLVMSLDFFSAFILILVLLGCILEKDKTMLLKIFCCMAAACAAALLLEATSIAISFSDFRGGATLRSALNNMSIICGYGLSFFYACYVANLVGPKRKHCQLTVRVLLVVSVVAACMLVAGSIQELFFIIESGEAVLVPGKLFVYIFAFDIFACSAGILLIVLYRKDLNSKDVTALMSLPSLIFLSAVLQYTFLHMMYGLFMMAATAVFIIYLMIQADRNRQQIAQEKQLMDMNVAMTLSQIQPHFLYNSLSSIRRMIRKDPAVAETAIENFSLYLRQNFESMTRTEPIPFSMELQHVEEYLHLEKLRFGERLMVEYAIDYDEFVLPTLTLQPIVENAVKHGIMQKEEGGRILIASRREGSIVIITVEDNGVGFVPGSDSADRRQHIGLNNVKSRITMQCKGTLAVESILGAGTKVTITLPLV